MIMKLELQEIIDGHFYATSPSFRFGLDDEKQRQFGLYVEILDMFDATGESEFEDYPFVAEISIVADKPHKSFAETDRKDKLNLLYDCHSYMGGVPITHTLTDGIKSSIEQGEDNFDCVAKQFTALEAKVIEKLNSFGTVAAQRGKVKSKYLQFKTEDAAKKYVQYLLDNRAQALSLMIGFILDKPINLMGDSGWSVISRQVKGKNSK